MSLLESKINSIAAIAINAEVNKASIDYVNTNYYNRTTTNTLLSNNILSLAPSFNPIFTGDVTAPSFNATSSIKINGNAVPTSMQVSDTLTNYLLSANAASTYAPKDNPSFNGTVNVTTSLRIANQAVPTANQVAVQFTLSGGGIVTWTGTHLRWTDRVLALPSERVELAAEGFHEIQCPTSGSVQLFNDPSIAVTTVTCTTNGIPLGLFQALYYEITSSRTSDQSRFRVVNYNNLVWAPTGSWLLLAVNNSDYGIKWMPGLTHIPKSPVLPATFNTLTGQCSWLGTQPWVSGRVSGVGVKISDSGRIGYSVARIGATSGRYTITMNEARPSANAFAVFPSVRGFFLATYGTPASNSVNFEIYIYTFPTTTTNAANADPTDFAFFTIP